jgi:eukaryotic-like serine/threonine-protein kinase
MQDDDALVRLAAEVADGARIDWRAAESAADSDAERDVVRQLWLLDRLADVHSHAAFGPASSRNAPAESTARQTSTRGPAPDAWGPLRLLEHIGEGSFGDVYRAWDTRLEREVALKLLKPRSSLGPSTETLPETAVLEEGRLMARVRHTGVVTVHGAERVDGRLGVWMERLDGRTLAAELAERGPLPAAEVRDIGIHLADALAAVHHAGVLHRDVKAQNVMREPSGRTVLMDFGTGLDRADEATALAGTPLYLAPEVIGGGPATRQSDIYALGVLLFHLVTGTFPVAGRTLGELRRAHVRGERQAVRERRPDVPAALAAIIERAIAAEPEVRFADAAAVAEALRRTAGQAGGGWAVALPAGLAALMLALGGLAAWSAISRPSAAPAIAGVSEVQIDPALQVRAAIRGPVIDGYLAPCHPRGSQGIAICNLRDGSIRPIRMPARQGESATTGRALISPDGRLLAHQWNDGTGETRHSLHVAPLDGTSAREIYRTHRPLALLRWTPDGRAVVFRELAAGANHDTGGSAEDVVVLRLDGDLPQRLRLEPGDSASDLSPDGRTLLVTTRTGDESDVRALDTLTGVERWRLGGPVNDFAALWRPDGHGVVFLTDRTGCEAVAHVSTGDNGPAGGVQILKDLGRNRALPMGMSPDGSYLISLQHASRTALRAEIPSDGEAAEAPRSLVFRCTEDSIGADWDPAGERIAFVSGNGDSTGPGRIVIQSRDGRLDREFAAPGSFYRGARLRWSPDGQRLAVLTATPGADAALTIIDLHTGATRTMERRAEESSPGGSLRDIRWHPDGNAVYFRQAGQIRRFDLQAASTSLVYSGLTGTFASFDVAPTDGALLVGVWMRESNECAIRIISSEGEIVDRARLPGECFAMAWSRDAGRLYVASDVRKLWTLDRRAGPPRLLSIEADAFWDLSISPDGREVLFTAGNPMPNIVQLTGIGR